MEDLDKSHHMALAFKTAFEKLGTTSPNPPVGAVIAKSGTVIAAAGTCVCGSDHAEVSALEMAGVSARGAEMFVTLEPCCHYGKTPPCTDSIIKSGISRVYIPLLDPNPKVAGKGSAALEAAGIEVVMMPEMRPKAISLYRPFKKLILHNKPFIIHKSALTIDGRTAVPSGDSRWVTGERSRFLVHRLRAKADAVIIGKGTFMRDDPSLTVRLGSFSGETRRFFQDTPPAVLGDENFFIESLIKNDPTEYENPCRVLFGFPENGRGKRFFSDDNYIVFETRGNLDRIAGTSDSGILKGDRNIVPVDGVQGREMIAQVMEELAARGFLLAVLEGGAALAGSFFDAGEIDQVMYFYSPKIAGDGIPVMRGTGPPAMDDALRLHDVSGVMIGDEMLLNGYRDAYGPDVKRGEPCLRD